VNDRRASKLVAYLVIAHHQPAHLARLIDRLDSDSVCFFVHVDRRADLAGFQASVGEAENVAFIPERRRYYWGGFGLARAMLSLLEAAIGHPDDEFKHVVFLSGVDYPIKPNEEILAHYAGSNGNHLSHWDPDSVPHRRKRYKGLHYLGGPLLNRYLARAGKLRKVAGFVEWRIYRLLERAGGRTPPFETPVVTGSNWFSLNRRTAEYVVDFVRVNPRKFEWFRHAFSPEEFVFHTIVRASPFWSDVVHHDRPLSELSGVAESETYNLRYIDWSPGRELPALLDMRDFDALARSQALFARKFDEQASAELLDEIDARLLTVKGRRMKA
jgi:hypothetical protein